MICWRVNKRGENIHGLHRKRELLLLYMNHKPGIHAINTPTRAKIASGDKDIRGYAIGEVNLLKINKVSINVEFEGHLDRKKKSKDMGILMFI
jgi:hypothetical protein